MNRKDAFHYIGKKVYIIDSVLGDYIGVLEDILLEPRKPWRGKVKKLKDGFISEVIGSKITPYSEDLAPIEESRYPLLLNELEEVALDSLEDGLGKYKMDHGDCVSCHYSLSLQKVGVNFITFQKGNRILLVQHHYERKQKNTFAFDRFEFTDQSGKRLIYTYTTQIS